MYTAAYNNRVEVIEALLELYGSERREIVNYVTQKGFTSLHAAALQGHPKCIRALINGGAKKNQWISTAEHHFTAPPCGKPGPLLDTRNALSF